MENDYSDIKWRSCTRKTPPNGVRLILKMQDADHNVSYAIGITDVETGKLWYSAREEQGTEPVQWMLMPD